MGPAILSFSCLRALRVKNEPMSAGSASTLTTYPQTPPPFALLGTDTASIDPPADLDGARKRLAVLSTGNAPEWIALLREAGVRAHRRGSPDLLGQLAAAVRRPVDTVVLNLLDAEPATCLNAAAAANFPAEVVAGAQVVARLGGATSWLLATDSRVPPAWWARLRAAQSDLPGRHVSLVNSYPQSDPTLLAYTLLSRKLRPGRLPTENWRDRARRRRRLCRRSIRPHPRRASSLAGLRTRSRAAADLFHARAHRCDPRRRTHAGRPGRIRRQPSQKPSRPRPNNLASRRRPLTRRSDRPR